MQQHFNLRRDNNFLRKIFSLLFLQVADIWLIPSCGGTIHFADKDALKGSLLNTLVNVRPTRCGLFV